VMDMYKSIGWELGLPTERNRASAFRVIRGEITRLTFNAIKLAATGTVCSWDGSRGAWRV